MVMLAVLAVGIYAAYKHFSGIDPLKLDPQAVVGVLSSIKIGSKTLPINNQLVLENSTPSTAATPVFRFLLVADSHGDNDDLSKALNQAKASYPDLKFIIGLGDYSDVGTNVELNNAKKELDSSGLRYFLIAGDHDLWDSRDKKMPAATNFNQVFGPVYQSFEFENFNFLLLDDSDDYKGLGDIQQKWIENELEKIKQQPARGTFVFLHEPLFHPSSDHVMGKIENGLPAGRQGLKQQARDLMYQLKAAGVKKVFAGDVHFFSEYTEPVTGLEMVTIGAVTIERNPQAPRFAVVSVFDDGTTKVDDVEIK